MGKNILWKKTGSENILGQYGQLNKILYINMNITRIDELYLKLKQQYPRYYHEHDLYIDKIYKLAKNYSQYINYE